MDLLDFREATPGNLISTWESVTTSVNKNHSSWAVFSNW